MAVQTSAVWLQPQGSAQSAFGIIDLAEITQSDGLQEQGLG